MANNPQKTQDPTEAALTAIQEALNIRPAAPSPAPTPSESAPGLESTRDLFHSEEGSDTIGLRAPANDDREQVGLILQALRRRPSRTPSIAAGLAAVVWAAAGLALVYAFSGELAGLGPKALAGAVAAIAAGIVVPIGLFYALAQMFSRAQDMRIVAESMAEVAMRMAQPETLAREAVVSVGQAVRREVAAMGDGVERALARAAELEALVHNEVSAIERAYNDNEVRVRDLINQLASQREMMVNQGDQVRNAIASVHLDLSHDITSVGDLVADKVSEVAQRVTRSLTEKGEVITLALGQAGDSMVDALSERGSTLLDKLESTSFHATSSITSASEQLVGSLRFRSETVHEEFADLAKRLESTLSARLENVQKNFAADAGGTMEAMAARSLQATQAITQAGASVTEAIAARGEEITSRLRNGGDALVQELGNRGAEVVGRIEQTGTRVADTVIARSNTVADTFRDNAEVLVKTIDNRGEAMREMLGARLKAFEEVFDGQGTELSEKISRDSGNLGNLITHHIGEFDHTVKTYGGELVERLGARTKDVADAMRAYLDSFDQRVTGRTGELSEHLDKRLSRFEELLGARVADMAKTLSEGGKDMVGALDRRIVDIGSTIDARAAEAADTLGSRADIIAETLDVRYGRLEELLVGRTEKVADVVENRTKAAADTLIARFEQLSHSIQVNSANAERNLGELAVNTSEAIRVSAGEAERTLRSVSDEVARGFIGKAEQIAREVSSRTQEMETILSDKSGSLLAAISDKGLQFGNEITKATEQAMSVIEERGYGFSRSVAENSEQIALLINAAGETAAETVNRTLSGLQQTAEHAITKSQETATATVNELMETHNILRSDTTALFGRLREANVLLQEVLTGSHENMSALENTLMLRVSEFVSAMNEVTVSTGEATGRMESNIGGFREVTSQVLTDLGQLARAFDVHGQELAKAADLIESSNRSTEQNVNERRVQIESLVNALDIRTDEIAERLKRFSGLIDQTLDAAAIRARDVARVVSEATTESARTIADQYDRVREQTEDVARTMQETGSESARAIGEQFERMRDQAEGERRRSSAAMRDIFEQSTGDTHALFEEANSRFAETLVGMKQMASEMQRELGSAREEVQRELEATRAELRRGVLELPQETAESTAQMRRVIVDQIEALAELNRIVARHGRSLDAVEPVRRGRDEQPLAIVGGRSETASRSEPVREPRPEPRTPPRDVASFAPAPRRAPAEPVAPAPIGPQPSAGRGWLSDLLNRASREEDEPAREFNRERAREPVRPEPAPERRGAEERSPRHSIESLDSLSVDIARMIDHDAATDLWDRYKRGERNVFTRRLYTLQGQQAFDEIRKKYRADREFKQTVDRYIGEFERLLEEVSRDDRSQVMARTYLTSETGKVYTMLGHAAGRFD